MVRQTVVVGCEHPFVECIWGVHPAYDIIIEIVRDAAWRSTHISVVSKVAVEVLIRLSPCQPDHAFESSTTIKVITMRILWPSSSLWKVRDLVTKDLRNHFDGELNPGPDPAKCKPGCMLVCYADSP